MSKRKIPEAETGMRRFEPAAFLETMAKGGIISTHRKQDIIFTQGDAADAVFYIRKSKIEVTVLSKQGMEAVVAILGVDEFVGEGCLIGQPKRLATASHGWPIASPTIEIVEIDGGPNRRQVRKRLLSGADGVPKRRHRAVQQSVAGRPIPRSAASCALRDGHCSR